MTDKPPIKVSFDFPGAMRQLGRLTRRAYDTVADATRDGEEEDTAARKKPSGSKPDDKQSG